MVRRSSNGKYTLKLSSLPITPAKISRATERDCVLSRVKHYILSGWPTKDEIPPELQPYYRRRDELSMEEGCLLWGTRVVIPNRYRDELMDSIHDIHTGVVRMKMLARQHCWWPNLDEQIENTARGCTICQSVQVKVSNRDNPWIWPSRPYQRD